MSVHASDPDMHSLPPERPRGQLFRSPVAQAVWAAVCALDEGDQHLVLCALQTRLAADALEASSTRYCRTRSTLSASATTSERLSRFEANL